MRVATHCEASTPIQLTIFNPRAQFSYLRERLLPTMPFGNRRGSARGAFDDDEPDTSGRPKSGGLAKIVRAASFSRRKKNDETSSGSSSTQSSPTADGTPLKGWLSKRHNKEKSVSQQWGRRYFSVDGVRGTLSYAKGEAKTPSAILPLADISSVTPFDGHKHGAHAFVISCPPVHLTVRAEDEQERTMWINGLTAKAAEWKGKSGVRTAVTLSGAGPVATATAEPEPSNFGTVTREAGDEPGGAVAGETYGYSEQPPPGTRLLPRDSVPKPSRRSPDLNRPRPASPERDSSGGYTDADGMYNAPLVVRHDLARSHPEEVSAVQTVELVSDDDDLDVVDGGDGRTIGGAPAAAGDFGIARTSDLDRGARDLASMLSSDEDEDDDLPPPRAAPTAARAAPAYCGASPAADIAASPLGADLMPAASAPAASAVAAASAAAAATAAAIDAAAVAEVPSSPASMPTVAAPAPAAPASPMSWLSAMPDSVYAESPPGATPPRAAAAAALPEVPSPVPESPEQAPPPPPPHESPSPIRPAAAAAAAAAALDPASPPPALPLRTAADEDWDSSPGGSPMPPPPPPPPADPPQPEPEPEFMAPPPSDLGPVAVGDGIVADSNFIEDDWDDEEE